MSTDNAPSPRPGFRTVTAGELEQQLLGGPITLGQALRNIRLLDHEATQVKMAKTLGLTKQELCDIERGRRLLPVKSALALAKRLGYSERVFAFYAIRDIARAQMRKAGLSGTMQFEVAC